MSRLGLSYQFAQVAQVGYTAAGCRWLGEQISRLIAQDEIAELHHHRGRGLAGLFEADFLAIRDVLLREVEAAVVVGTTLVRSRVVVNGQRATVTGCGAAGFQCFDIWLIVVCAEIRERHLGDLAQQRVVGPQHFRVVADDRDGSETAEVHLVAFHVRLVVHLALHAGTRWHVWPRKLHDSRRGIAHFGQHLLQYGRIHNGSLGVCAECAIRSERKRQQS